MDLGLEGKVALVMAASRAWESGGDGARPRGGERGDLQPRRRNSLPDRRRDGGGDWRRGGAPRRRHHPGGGRAGPLLAYYQALRRPGRAREQHRRPARRRLDDFDDDGWQAGFELVLLSLIRAVRGALPLMRERGGGRIVNIASSSIKQPIENLILSNTFRAAISGLAKSLAIELAPDGILVNTIGPGRISTARSRSMDERNAEAAGVAVEEVRGQFEAQIPLGRYGTPEEFARVVAFLASPPTAT